jgi:magnesium chelatase subunit I
VSLLNVLEERDIQIRGYNLRLPLDVLLVASANPEDYTNRGRIITPLKDRFGAEVRTHYPDLLEDEVDVVRQEAHLAAVVPDFLLEVVARFARNVRESSSVDQRSGVSARFAIAAAETAAASALRRAALTGEELAVARVCDLPATVATLRGKVEFEVDEEGRELEVLAHLLRKATVETFRQHLGASDLRPLIERFDEGLLVESGDLVPGRRLLEQVGPLPGLAHVLERLGVDEGAETPELAASALEFAFEGLFLNRRISKDDSTDGGVLYGSG